VLVLFGSFSNDPRGGLAYVLARSFFEYVTRSILQVYFRTSLLGSLLKFEFLNFCLNFFDELGDVRIFQPEAPDRRGNMPDVQSRNVSCPVAKLASFAAN
jgi:hypothetical protein